MSRIQQIATAEFCRASSHTHGSHDPTSGEPYEECPYGVCQGRELPSIKLPDDNPDIPTFVELSTLMDTTVVVDVQDGYGIGLSVYYPDRRGTSTRLSIGQARAIAAQLIAAAETHEASSVEAIP